MNTDQLAFLGETFEKFDKIEESKDGDAIVTAKKISRTEALGGYQYILLLYTSSWCPGCRYYNDQLLDAYNDWNSWSKEAKAYTKKCIQVVAISCDRD